MAGESWDGYTNKITHDVFLWLSNEEGSYKMLLDQLRDAVDVDYNDEGDPASWTFDADKAAATIEQFTKDWVELSGDTSIGEALRGDLSDLSDVNWSEVAEAFEEDAVGRWVR